MKVPPFSTGRSARSGHGPRRSWSTNQAMPANPETSSRHLHQLCARRIRLRACTRNTRTHHTHHTHTHARVRTHTHHTHAHAHAHTHTHSRKRHADRQQARTDCKVEAQLFFPELPGDSEREARFFFFFFFFFFFSFGFDFFLLCFFEAWLSLPLSLLLLLLLRDRRRFLDVDATSSMKRSNCLWSFSTTQIKQQPVPGCCAPH